MASSDTADVLNSKQDRESLERELVRESETFGRAATDAEFDEALAARGVISLGGSVARKRIDGLLKKGAFVESLEKAVDPKTRKPVRRSGVPSVVPDGITRQQQDDEKTAERTNRLAGTLAVCLSTKLARNKKLQITPEELWPMVEDALKYIRSFHDNRSRTVDAFGVLLDEIANPGTTE